MIIPIKQILTEDFDLSQPPILNKFDGEGASKFIDNAYRDAQHHTNNLPHNERKAIFQALQTGNENLANDRMSDKYLPTRTFDGLPSTEENPFDVANRQAHLEAERNRGIFKANLNSYNNEQAKLHNQPIQSPELEPTRIEKIGTGIGQYGVPVLAGAGTALAGKFLYDRYRNRSH